MRLHLVTGFLGSGKTTLVTRLVSAAAEKGLRVAVIVNEVGEVGIDGQLMKKLEMDVWELSSGCICCSLSSDLVSVLNKLDERYRTDLVIIEPSGVAEPGNIFAALPNYKKHESVATSSTCIVDARRIEELYEVLSPLISDQVGKSGHVIISKVDLAEEREIEKARAIVYGINPRAEVLELDIRQNCPADILGRLLT